MNSNRWALVTLLSVVFACLTVLVALGKLDVSKLIGAGVVLGAWLSSSPWAKPLEEQAATAVALVIREELAKALATAPPPVTKVPGEEAKP